MAILTLADVQAGGKPPVPLIKTGIAMAAVAAYRGHTYWYASGNPGASSATAIGINGGAVTYSSSATTIAGRIYRANPSGAEEAKIARLSLTPNGTSGTFWLIDRLWHNSGLIVTSTGAQAITPATLPARDLNATTNGLGVMAAIEWSATGGAGTPTVTLTYTDQDGNTGATGTFTGVATPPVGTFEIFNFAAGDSGIRAPTSFIQSATRTAGTMHLVLFRVLAQVETANLIGSSIDIISSGGIKILNDAVLQLVFFPNATTATSLVGTYIETQK